MYTFYFRACPAGLSGTTQAKLIAIKGIMTPKTPVLGEEYSELILKALVENGHRVVIDPVKAWHGDKHIISRDREYTPTQTMRYAKGYGPVQPAPSAVQVKDAAIRDYAKFPVDADDIRKVPFVVHRQTVTLDELQNMYPECYDQQNAANTILAKDLPIFHKVEKWKYQPFHRVDTFNGGFWSRVGAWFSRNFLP